MKIEIGVEYLLKKGGGTIKVLSKNATKYNHYLVEFSENNSYHDPLDFDEMEGYYGIKKRVIKLMKKGKFYHTATSSSYIIENIHMPIKDSKLARKIYQDKIITEKDGWIWVSH